MKASRHFEEKGDELMKQADMAQESCDWWVKEVESSLEQLDEWEKFHIEDMGQGQKALKNLEYLLSKSGIEQKNLDKVEDKIEKYLFYKKIIEEK